MGQSRVYFKNLNPLHLNGELNRLLFNSEDDSALTREIEGFKSQNISSVAIFHDEDFSSDRARQNLKRLVDRCTGLGLGVLKASLKYIRQERFDIIKFINDDLHAKLQNGACLLLYSWEERSLVEAFLPTLLVHENPNLLPRDALHTLLESEVITTDNAGAQAPVFRYRQTLYQATEIPPPANHLFTEKLPGKIGGLFKNQRLKKQGQNIQKQVSGKPADIRIGESGQDGKTGEKAQSRGPIFKASRWFTIRFKLLSIISLILITALGGMTYFAGLFFTDASVTRVQEHNLNLVQVLHSRVQLELKGIIYKAGSLLARVGPGQGVIPGSNRHLVFAGIARRQKGNLVFTSSLFNRKSLGEKLITDEQILELHRRYTKHFSAAFNGTTAVENVSPTFKTPLLAISLPYRLEDDSETGAGSDKEVPDAILIILLAPDNILKAFQNAPEVGNERVTLMVNNRGYLIAHPDSNMILFKSNLSDSPFVQAYLKSNINRKQLPFTENNERYLGSFIKLEEFGLCILTSLKENAAMKTVNRIQWTNILITLIFLTLAILIVFFFSLIITRPIVRLVQASHEIAEGNYDLDIQPASRDEIGLLTSSFTDMSRGLEEREKVKDALGTFVSQEIAEKAVRGELKLGGERKRCTILFSDLRSFTSIAESMEPEQVVEFLNEYFEGMLNCLAATQGVVDKFVGDAIMAYWGALHSDENHTHNAVEATLMMRKSLEEFNFRNQGKWPHVRFGIGINTGEVIAGQIGSKQRMQYTLIGDPVNLASRVEGVNKRLGTDILLTEDSYKLVKDEYSAHEFEPMQIRGKKEEIKLFALLGRKDDPDAPGSLEELQAMLDDRPDPGARL